MKFKHTFHVFVDNFSVTYKLLIYRIITTLISIGLYTAVLYPFIKGLADSAQYRALVDGIKAFLSNFVNGHPDEMANAAHAVRESFADVMRFIAHNRGNIYLGIFGLVFVHFVEKFLGGLGNYAAGALINDRMAMRAKSPFVLTLVKNLKEACVYNLMYAPLSIAYDLACASVIFLLLFKALTFLPFILKIFLFVTMFVAAISVKMTFTSDWLPALICGKKDYGGAFTYAFSRRKKNTASVLSNFVVMVLIIFGLNFAAAVFTFGAAILLTVPASYLILISFEFVNYYDREELKYFVDNNTIIKPAHEKTPTREEFFRGEQ